MPTVVEYNCLTRETIVREMTPEELEGHNARVANWPKMQEKQIAAEAQRAADLKTITTVPATNPAYGAALARLLGA